jgi:hypothetical protein
LYPPQEVQGNSGDNNNNNKADDSISDNNDENENVVMATNPPPKAKGCQRSCCEQDIFLPMSKGGKDPSGDQPFSSIPKCDADKADYVAATPPAKQKRNQRERNKPDYFIAEPSNDAQLDAFIRQRFREANEGEEKKKRKAFADVENKARVEALPDAIKVASTTAHGRKMLAQALTQDPSKPITVSGVNSKSALSRFKQTAVAIGNGMANLVAPANPKFFLESMTSKKSVPARKEVEQENSTTPRTVTSEEADGQASFFIRTPSPKKKKKPRMSPVER